MSYEDEYEYFKKNGKHVYGYDQLKDAYQSVVYDTNKGWYNQTTNIKFPYAYLKYFDSPHEEKLEHTPISIPIYEKEMDTPKNITLSVIINAHGKTNLKRFLILLASLNCELLKPFVGNRGKIFLLYKRLLDAVMLEEK